MTATSSLLDKRDAFICALACVLGLAAAGIAEVLVRAIALVTNIAFYGHWSFTVRSPGGNNLGMFVILVPIIGGISSASWLGSARGRFAGTASRRRWSRC